MPPYTPATKKIIFSRSISLVLRVFMGINILLGPIQAHAEYLVTQPIAAMNLPPAGTRVMPSAPVSPATMMGLNVFPDNPLKFDFLVTRPDPHNPPEQEYGQLIQYFLTSLTTPEKNMWVNLSPYEKERIIPETFGRTTMGRDLLSLDYMLKQLSASLLDPDAPQGRQFWARLYARAQTEFGTTDIPMNTFNKIWIIPDKATLYEHAGGVMIIASHLKVMLEEDYLALNASRQDTPAVPKDTLISGMSAEMARNVLLPEIEKEVNEGATFQRLRQIYHAMLLASWYKDTLKESALGKTLVDQNKISYVTANGNAINQEIYNRYVRTFKDGVINMVREETDPLSHELVPRKYFSGGVTLTSDHATITSDAAQEDPNTLRRITTILRQWPAINRVMCRLSPSPKTSTATELPDIQARFDDYLAQDPYLKDFKDTPLRNAFTPEIMAALLYDKTLRAVFLRPLYQASGQVGPLKAVNQNVLKRFGGKALLDTYTGFLAGNAARANEEMIKGNRIIVGVTDRWSKQAFAIHTNPVNVANRRRCFFPLPDGSWLAIKGIGDLNDEQSTIPWQYENDHLMGLANLFEANFATLGRKITQGSSFMSNELLGYRELKVLPNGSGELIKTSEIPVLQQFSDENEVKNSVVLIFDRVLSPHRCIKLPQILANDPGLIKLHASMVRVLVNNRLTAPGSPRDMILDLIRQTAKNMAFKTNEHLYKASYHLQDIGIVRGQEADNEEFIPFASMIRIVSSHTHIPFVLSTLQDHALNMNDIYSCLELLLSLEQTLRHDSSTISIFQSPQESLTLFLTTYFSSLSDENLKIWLNTSDVIQFGQRARNVSRLVQSLYLPLAINQFHPAPSGHINRDKFEVLLMIQTLLEHEAERRAGVKQPLGPSSAPRSPSILISTQFEPSHILVRETFKDSEKFGNYNFPAEDKGLITAAFQTIAKAYPAHIFPENTIEQCIAYGTGNKTHHDALQAILGQIPASPDNTAAIIKEVLYVTRITAKYTLNEKQTRRLLGSFINATPSPAPEPMSLEDQIKDQIQDQVMHHEIEQLKTDDHVFSLDNINPLDLGDPDTLKEVDASMNNADAELLDLRARFDEYLARDPYLKSFKDTPLKKVFTPEIMKVLLNDPVLRPVFLLSLSESKGEVGPLKAVDEELAARIGGKATLDAYTGFLVGNAGQANEEIKRSHKIIVGVTDRWSDITLMPNNAFNVANRRRVFFPLPDGSWLSIKGAGDLNDEETLTTYNYYPDTSTMYGLISLNEVLRVEAFKEALKNPVFMTNKFLGYRKLNVLTDGLGGLTPVSNAQYVLDFEQVLTPHRLSKLPQLLAADPGLRRLHADLQKVFINNHMPAPPSPRDMLLNVIRQMALNLAFKNNNHLYKLTYHAQDVAFSGEESDRNELIPYESIVERMSSDAYQLFILPILKTYKLNMNDIYRSLRILLLLTQNLSSYDGTANLIGEPQQALHLFFNTYFSNLSDQNLTAWLDTFDVIEFGHSKRCVSRMLQSIYLPFAINQFHPAPSGHINRDKFEVLLMLQSLLDHEAQRRGIALPSISTSTPVSPSILGSEKYAALFRIVQRNQAHRTLPLPAKDINLIATAFHNIARAYPLLNTPPDAVQQFMAYGMGTTSHQNAFQSLLKAMPEQSAGMQHIIRQALHVVRITAKYDLSPEAMALLLTTATTNTPVSRSSLLLTDSFDLPTLLNEIKKLMKTESLTASSAPDPLRLDGNQRTLKEENGLPTLDLGEPDTLKEVDASMELSETRKTDGGIDLNRNMMALDVKKENAGFQKKTGALAADNTGYFIPIITDIFPVKDVMSFLPETH